jgi:general secretion pathway protein J
MKRNGFNSCRRSAEHGFTLVEMLVALLIFGMLTAAGVSLLSFSVRAQESSDQSLGELSKVRRIGALLTADLGQAAPRLYRNERGEVRPAFSTQTASLAFVRRGWENLDGAPRSSLQRVEYRLSGDRLERVHYPMVDGAAPADAVVLASDLRRLTFRYRAADGGWRDSWDPEDPRELPRAVELVMETERMGALRQLFLVGAGG